MDAMIWMLLALVVVTLIGHGLWVLARVVLGGLAGMFQPGFRRPPDARVCPRCLTPWPFGDSSGRCPICEWPAPVVPAGAMVARRALGQLARQAEHYERLGLIPAGVRDRIVAAATAEAAAPQRASQAVSAEVAFEPEAPTVRAPAAAPITPDRAPVQAPAVTVGARARAFREAREGGGRPEPAPEVLPERERAQPWIRLLAAFFEEQNIRWGELVGGLLIVGCSLALVISFWSSIAERPLLKFGLFCGVTGLMFGFGLHAERRWRLPNTAQGLLIIANLLTPLTFLAVAAMGRGVGGESAAGIAGEVAAAGLFAWLVRLSGKTLVGRAPATLAAGVVVPSVALLLIRRWIAPGAGDGVVLALGAAPLAALGGAVGGLLWRSRREPEVGAPAAFETLRLLGLGAFAATLALGLLIARAGPLATALHRAAPLAPLAGAVALAPGLWLWRRTTAPALASLRTAGTAIAAAGTLLLLAGIALAWPSPAGMLSVALLDFVALTTLAVVFGVPAAHALAGGCLVLAYLLGDQLATGAPGGVLDAVASGRAGGVLLPVVLLFAAAAAGGPRFGRRSEAQAYGLVAALAGVLSVGLLAVHGFGRAGDPLGVAWIFTAYAPAGVVLARRFERHPLASEDSGVIEARTLAWSGVVLALAASIQAIVFARPGAVGLPWTVALLTFAAAAAGGSLLLDRFGRGDGIARSVLDRAADLGAIAAAVVLVAHIPDALPDLRAWRFLGLSAVCALGMLRDRRPARVAALQAATTATVVFTVAAMLQRQDWYARSP